MKDSLPLLSTDRPRKRQRPWKTLVGGTALFAVCCFFLSRQLPTVNIRTSSLVVETNKVTIQQDDRVVMPGISAASMDYGLHHCRRIHDQAHAHTNTTRRRHRNPRAGKSQATLITNAQLWVGDQFIQGDLLVENGLIQKVGTNLAAKDAKVVDAQGRIVTPGIVDMHSHMGVYSLPALQGNSDGNEMVQPTTPFVRVHDAIDPTDPGIKIITSGGITTSLILPGSGNLMGGEAAVVKHRPVPTLSVYDMLVSAGLEKEDQEVAHRYMKMACGENPKNFYGPMVKMPMTRLGEGYLFREQFAEASSLLRSQDDWCDAAEHLKQEGGRLATPFPEKLALESLVALLRGQVKLNVHCYLPQDLEAMVDHSLEFGFEIAAFHHALSAWQVPEIIKRAKSNITIATFGDMWGYKREAWFTNVQAPNILTEAGIPVAFKSDHPVMNARDLVHEAQKAYHYGFDEHLALSALTSVPANALGLGHRIGSLKEGYDADLVIWERHPLRLGARPKQVMIDGDWMDFTKPWSKGSDDLVDKEYLMTERDAVPPVGDVTLPPRPNLTMRLEDHGTGNPVKMQDACGKDSHSFVLRNIGRLVMGPDQTYQGSQQDQLYLIVQNGTVVCAGHDCDRKQFEWPAGGPVFDVQGGVILPGLVSSGVPMGMMEIQAEPTTQDGLTNHDVNDAQLYKTIAKGVDGIKMHGLHMVKAFQGGVTSTISQPLMGAEPLAGVSVAVRTGVKNTVLDSEDAIIKEEAALQFTINHGLPGPTISQQIASIRRLLLESVGKDEDKNVFARATRGELPVVIQVDNKDEIAAVIRLKQTLIKEGHDKAQLIVLGGAEAYLVAGHLAHWKIPVLLMPARCHPILWPQRQCLPGHPFTKETGLDVLLRYKVTVGLASTDVDNGDARNLIWEAGWNLAHNDQFSFEEAVGLVTWNIGSMFGLKDVGRLSVGGPADFVMYDGNPFEFGTRAMMVNGGAHEGPLCAKDMAIF
ncbi:composite domain of metallo-dependent hydrolase [Hesseltinella vesiculosa]|uniref:Composite domain of metallo-dependent hydrolase n=1 Tax=Hesseltinella vesiculosa TaxID=101127 RepID=A0A1X2GT03_9FUNG|nr:composite domain of metallo-dependent hydrolase [Hesseltinella vesiculosa]